MRIEFDRLVGHIISDVWLAVYADRSGLPYEFTAAGLGYETAEATLGPEE